MMPLSRLSHIDFRRASALQGVWKLVERGSSDQFRVQESGDAGIPLRGSNYFAVSFRENVNNKLYFL